MSQEGSGDYQGTIPIDGKSGIEARASSYDVDVVCFEGVAMVYGDEEEAERFTQDEGSHMYESVKEAQDAKPNSQEMNSEAMNQFGELFP